VADNTDLTLMCISREKLNELLDLHEDVKAYWTETSKK